MKQVGRRWREHHRMQRDTRCDGPDRREGGGEDRKTCSSRSRRALWTMEKSNKKLLEHFKI